MARPQPVGIWKPWETCGECLRAGMVHATLAELLAAPIGSWRREFRGDQVAVRWFTYPEDDVPKPWKLFGPWGVDEVTHAQMAESEPITIGAALERLGIDNDSGGSSTKGS